jgi:hypothetical protein
MGLIAVALIGAVVVAAIIALVRREHRRAQADEWAGTSQAGVSFDQVRQHNVDVNAPPFDSGNSS